VITSVLSIFVYKFITKDPDYVKVKKTKKKKEGLR